MALLPDDWKKIQVPLSLVVAFLTVVAGAWAWMHSEFVLAEDFKAAIQSIEIRGIERDKKLVETEVLKLEVKKDALPEQFNAVDRALLEKHKQDLIEIKQDLKETKKRAMQLKE
jgi:hypothetical protein